MLGWSDIGGERFLPELLTAGNLAFWLLKYICSTIIVEN